MDNNAIAILGKVNELMLANGIHPCDTVVTIRNDESRGTVLFFESPPPAGPARDRFLSILGELGDSEQSLELAGTDRSLYDQLQTAIDRSPKSWSR